MGTRAGADVDSLAELVKLRDEVDGQLVRSVLACHAAGYSWADIGDRLGITRQAAFKRFAPLAERDAIHGRAPLTPPNRTVGI
jgi:hypothetical protein